MDLFKCLFFPSFVKKEKVIIYTENYELTGWLFNSGFSKANRFLSNLLNGANKNFIAVTDCEITYYNRNGAIEKVDFLQLNLKYVILIRPAKEVEKTD
jgi:hypothetical protein